MVTMVNRINIKKTLILIILLEIVLAVQFNVFTHSQSITSASFFIIEKGNQQGLNSIKQNLKKLGLTGLIKISSNNESVIHLSAPNPNKKTNAFINNLLKNHSSELSLKSFQSHNDLDFKLAYLFGLLFIFIPTLVYWLVLIKKKECNFANVNKVQLINYSFILLILTLMMNLFVVKVSGIESMSNVQNLNPFIQENHYISFVFIVLFAPIVEELLFRGVLLRYFIDKDKFFLGSIIISGEFLLAHYGYFQASIELTSLIVMGVGFTTLSLLLCWTYYKFNSIIAPIFLHMINNLLGYLFILNQ